MKNISKAAFIAFCFMALSGVCVYGADQVVGLDALSGFDHLLVWRDGVRTGMISSTSPLNRNIDFSHYHGLYKGRRVIFKASGPGCIYRVWSALPAGTVRFYIDGERKPVLKCGFKEYLQGGCGDTPSFSVGRTAQYLPIPYNESAVITTVGFDVLAFYQVSYQSYDDALDAPIFSPASDAGDPAALEKAKAFWESNGASDLEGRNLDKKVFEVEIKPGESVPVYKINGQGTVRKFSLADARDPLRSLSGLELRVYTDGRKKADIDSPAHAFFGSYYESRDEWPGGRWSNIAFDAGPEGFACRLPMPYGDGIRIEIKNTGDTKRAVKGYVSTERKRLNEGAMRLHACFKNKDYETDVTKLTTYGALRVYDPADNYVVLERKGRGYYVGCYLYVMSVGPDWWGEGDENTYIDGETWPPDIQGTGTEDEFNWSWGYKKYLSPISGILINTPADIAEGKTAPNTAYRFRVSDYVPFRDSIKVSYERQGAVSVKRYPGALINQSKTRGDDFASVAYWYEAP